MTLDARKFRNTCALMCNIDKDELETANVIKLGAVGGSDWTRFNRDPLLFILKLPDGRFQALWELLESKQPNDMKESPK